MLVEELDVPGECREILKEKGIRELNPVQRKAAEIGFGKDMVVASPTASGKTLISEIAFMKKIMEKKKVVYIVPLRALAYEKYQEFKNYPFKVALSIGDLDSSDPWLADYDMVIVTSEKMDSLLRHKPKWVEDIGLVIVDEIHLLNDAKRGPTLEVILTSLRKHAGAQVLGLSATIKNAEEIGKWLDAETVRSDYRPIDLKQGVFDGQKLEFPTKNFKSNEKTFPSKKPGELLLAKDTVDMGKQSLIFASTKRNAESIAEKTGEFLKLEKNEEREKLSDRILNALSRPTKQCRRLANCVKMGTAFHHAGLVHSQRVEIEKAFREGKIKIISATPTLAFGVNLPAYRVFIRDTKRYYPGHGFEYIPVLEYFQMIGRAGRPAYDKEGQAIMISKSRNEADKLVEKFIMGEPEEIFSKLSVEPILRMHVLSLITVGLRTEKKLKEFFSNTFFAYQFGDISQIERKINDILKRLNEQRFIVWTGQDLIPTKIGKRVSELYLDPESAYWLLKAMENGNEGSVFSYLVLISHTTEMGPLNLRKDEFDKFLAKANRMEEDLFEIPGPWDVGFDNFVKAVKTASVLEDWINELGDDKILDRYGVTPGMLRGKIETADWLIYACQELAYLSGNKEKNRKVKKLRIRLKNGIREELLPLVSLKGIGRVKARKLYDNGFRSLADLRKAPEKRLNGLIGEKTTDKIKEQLNVKKEQDTL